MVFWIDGGLHATETVNSQSLAEMVYQMVSRTDDETMRFLDDVVLLMPVPNPDGVELVATLTQGPWNLNGQLGLVVGATYPAEIERVRALAPTVPLLIPGVGAQGGDAVATVKAGWRGVVGGETVAPIIVNSSRAILYASSGIDFAQAARLEALHTRDVLQAAKA